VESVRIVTRQRKSLVLWGEIELANFTLVQCTNELVTVSAVELIVLVDISISQVSTYIRFRSVLEQNNVPHLVAQTRAANDSDWEYTASSSHIDSYVNVDYQHVHKIEGRQPNQALGTERTHPLQDRGVEPPGCEEHENDELDHIIDRIHGVVAGLALAHLAVENQFH